MLLEKQLQQGIMLEFSSTMSSCDASLLTVPFVVRTKILTQLQLHDHLTLRQVCRTTRDWIDYSSIRTQHVPQTTLQDHGAKTFTNFLERRPPHVITSLYVENEDAAFLNDPALSHFLKLYSASITHIRVKRFFTCHTEEELKFYESFTNLKHLQIDKISIPSQVDVVEYFPANFKHLKVLKIGDVKAMPEPPDDLFSAALIPFNRQRPMGLYAWKMIKHCENIELLGYPRTGKYFFQAFIDGRGRGEFGLFCDFVRQRYVANPNAFQFVCDFKHEHWSPDIKNALALLKLGHEFGVKYLNLNANQFQYIRISSLIRNYDLPSSAGNCILSFKNFNCLVTEKLDRLEKISMSSSEVNTMLDYSCIFNGPAQFPNLKEIEIIIDTGFTSEAETNVYHRAREFKDIRTLLSHFFYDMDMMIHDDAESSNSTHVRKYESVVSLAIKFPELKQGWKANPEDLPLEWIVGGVPNLKKLELCGWSVKSEDGYRRIWRGLNGLNQLVLQDCDNLNVGCFDGCPDLNRVTLKNCKVDDEGLLQEYFESERSMQSSFFLTHVNNVTWIKC